MKNIGESATLIRLNDNTKRIYEEQKGEDLTLFNPIIRKVLRRKDNTFTIEPILFYNGDTKSIDEYNRMLLRKRGYLALEVSNDLLKCFSNSQMETFVYHGANNLYTRASSLKDKYTLIDYNTGLKYGLDAMPLMIVRRSLDGCSIEEYSGSLKNCDTVNTNLKASNFSSGLYFDVDERALVPELHNYLLTLSRSNDGKYYIVEEHLFLLNGLDPKGLQNHIRRIYLMLVQKSVPVVLHNKQDSTFSIHTYTVPVDSMKVRGSLAYAVSFMALQSEIEEPTISAWLAQNVLEAEYTPGGYVLKKIDTLIKQESY